MAFNPGGITYADPFGAFLTGNVIGREQNRADDQLAMQRAQERRQQDQFDWTKALRPGQEQMQAMTIEEMAANNARRALENREFADFAPFRQRAAQRGDESGALQLDAAKIATLPVARAQANKAAVDMEYSRPLAEASLAGQNADVAYRNTAIRQMQDAIFGTQAGRALTPLAVSPDGQFVTIANYQGGTDTIPTQQWQQSMDAVAQGIMGSRGGGQQSQGQEGVPDILGFGELYSTPPPAPATPDAPAVQPQAAPIQPRPVYTIGGAAAMAPQFMPVVSEVPEVDPIGAGLTRRSAAPTYTPPPTLAGDELRAYFRDIYR